MSDQPKPLFALCDEWRSQADYSMRNSADRDIHCAAAAEQICADVLESALKLWDAELMRAHGSGVPLEVRNIIEQIRWRLLGFKLEGTGQPREQILGLPKGTGE